MLELFLCFLAFDDVAGGIAKFSGQSLVLVILFKFFLPFESMVHVDYSIRIDEAKGIFLLAH
jgi:hypothetical protein